MRLINADAHECWACVHHQNETGKCDTWCDAGEAFELREDVKNAPTAYELDKVLEKLECQAEQYNNRAFEHEAKGFIQMADKYYSKQYSYQHAIEIVKSGVVENESMKRKEEWDPAIIGERIIEALGDRTQKWLAKETGVTEVSIWRYIQGERMPKADTIAKIAKALHVSADFILGMAGGKDE